MKPLTISHPNTDNNPITFLSADAAAGATSFTVKNTNGFTTGDYIIVGKFGIAQTEILQIGTLVSSTAIPLVSAAIFPHSTDTIVVQCPYNQFRIYRSTTGINGPFTALVTEWLQVDQIQNKYNDLSGAANYYYEFSYFNSTSNAESDKTAPVIGGGFSFFSLKTLQDRVAKIFGDPNFKFLDRDEITDWINELYEKLQEQVTGGESPYFITNTIITSTGAVSYDLSSFDIIHIFLIELSSDNGVTWDQFLLPNDFRYQLRGERAVASYYRIGGNTMFVDPIVPTGQQMRVWFFTTPVLLQDQTDELMNPFKGQTRLFVNYALQRCFEKDRKITEFATYYEQKNTADVAEVVQRIKARIKSVGKMVQMTAFNDLEQVL